jgi:hypothetical protein
MAAAMDEWQPWQFRLDNNHVELSADASPAAADPDGRELMIRCGTALFHLKLALKRFGCLGRVELFPEFGQAGLVARVHCGFSPDCGAQEIALFEAMSRDRNSSASWNKTPVSESVFGRFEGAMAGEKAWLEFSQSNSSRNRLLEFAEFGVKAPATGNAPETSTGNSRVAQWTRPLLTFIVRTGDSGQVSVEPAGPRAEQMEMLAVVKTKTDDKHGWLATGQAMARVRLQARVSEISLQIFDQAFRSRYVREELRTSIGHKGFAQVLIGFGSHPAAWAASPPASQPVNREGDPGAAIPLRFRSDK